MKKAIAYLRKSSYDKLKKSLEIQAENIEYWCLQNKIEQIAVYSDDNKSGKSFDRPDWIKLETFIKENHAQIDYLLIDAFDRFSRNLREALEMTERIEEKFKIKIVSVSEPISVSPEHPDYFFERASKHLNAHHERLRIRYRCDRGMWKANKKGKHIGNAPYGYTKIGAGENSTFELDPIKSKIIKQAYEMLFAGTSKIEIKRYIEGTGYPRKGKDAINKMLSCPLYGGFVKVRSFAGQDSYLTKSIYPGIISPEQWHKAQSILFDSPKRSNSVLNDEVPLRGVLHCTCGKKLTAASSKGKYRHYWYYFCKEHRKININAETVHRWTLSAMDHLSLPGHYIEKMKSRLKSRFEAGKLDNATKLAELNSRLKDIEGKLTSLEGKFISDSIDKATYDKWRNTLQTEQNDMTRQINALSAPVNIGPIQLEMALGRLSNLRFLYEIANTTQKQTLISLVFNRYLSWAGNVGRTHSVDPLFTDTAMIMNKKGLLEIEQPDEKQGVLHPGSGKGSQIELLCLLVNEICA